MRPLNFTVRPPTLDSSLRISTTISRLGTVLLLFALVIYIVGFRAILHSACGPAPHAWLIFPATWISAFLSGLAVAYALIDRTIKGWFILVAALATSGAAVLGIQLARLMCSGV